MMTWQDRNGYWHSCHSSQPLRERTIPAMQIEILFFDGFDDLDGFGPFEVLNEAGIETRFVTIEPQDVVVSAHGARIVPSSVVGDPDLVLIPGGGYHDREGKGAYHEIQRGAIPEFLRRRHAAGGRVGSVCTGAMILAAAGILKDRPAITHHTAIEDLRAAGANVVDGSRVVDDGDVITAAGVTSGIDLALHLVEAELGAAAADAGAREIEWTRNATSVA
jgi:putative intracellular protease/amidase